jgi:hypothetical protein
MNAPELVERARADGVSFELREGGGVRLSGVRSARLRWRSSIVAAKSEIVAFLSNPPKAPTPGTVAPVTPVEVDAPSNAATVGTVAPVNLPTPDAGEVVASVAPVEVETPSNAATVETVTPDAGEAVASVAPVDLMAKDAPVVAPSLEEAARCAPDTLKLAAKVNALPLAPVSDAGQKFIDWRVVLPGEGVRHVTFHEGATVEEMRSQYPAGAEVFPVIMPPSREATEAERGELWGLLCELTDDDEDRRGCFASGVKEIDNALRCFRELVAKQRADVLTALEARNMPGL